MSKSVLYMSMSLDGFIAGPNERLDNPLGDGGERLHEWMLVGSPAEPSGVNGEVVNEFMSTGAVVAGRGTFEPAGGWGGDDPRRRLDLHPQPSRTSIRSPGKTSNCSTPMRSRPCRR